MPLATKTIISPVMGKLANSITGFTPLSSAKYSSLGLILQIKPCAVGLVCDSRRVLFFAVLHAQEAKIIAAISATLFSVGCYFDAGPASWYLNGCIRFKHEINIDYIEVI